MNLYCKYSMVVIFVIFSLLTNSQVDTSMFIRYTPEFRFTEGIYLNFEQVKNNNPVLKERLETTADYNSLDFFVKVIEEKKIVYYDDRALKQEIETDKIWGYCRLGALFIRYNDDFNRIPIVGSIAHFVSEYALRYNNRYYDPYNSSRDPFYYDPYHGASSTQEMREYIIEFSTGNVMDFDRNSLKIILMKDTSLYDEFNNLSKRKQKKMLFYYLRKFNERNPLLIPKE